MDIVALCPLPVGGYAWQPCPGDHAFVVIVKATFAVHQGQARLVPVQDALVRQDTYWDDRPKSSVYAPSDMAPFKKLADVTLVGDAHSPLRGGARRLAARLAVGAVDKRISVVCDRFVNEQGRISLGKSFRAMPLRYEHAAASVHNPVGVHDDDVTNDRRLPNLEAIGEDEAGAVACFGPIGAVWAKRRELLGEHHASFVDDGWREQPLPTDVDPAFFNVAPTDQRIERIAADQRITVEHVHASSPQITCQLPGVQPCAFMQVGDEARAVALSADSLWIDMTRNVCTVTWRGSLDIEDAQAHGRVLVALQEPGEALSWSEVVEIERQGGRRPSAREATSLNEADGPPSDSQVRARDSEPEIDIEFELAVGADGGQTQAIRRRYKSKPLPFDVSADALPSSPVAPPVSRRAMPLSPMAPPPLPPPPPPSLPSAAMPLPSAAAMPAASATAVSTPSSSATSSAPGAVHTLTTSNAPVVDAPGSPWVDSAFSKAHFSVRPPLRSASPAVEPPPLMLVPASDGKRKLARAKLSDVGAGPMAPGQRVELLGNDIEQFERVREHWQLEQDDDSIDPLARELRAAFGSTEPIEPGAAQRQVVRIMSRHEACSSEDMRQLMSQAVDVDGVYHAPLALVWGQLQMAFEEVATLKATMACVAPYLKQHEALFEVVSDVRRLQKQGLIDSPDVAEELTAKVLATAADIDAIDNDNVEQRVERMLLTQRAHKKRALLGGEWLVAHLVQNGGVQMPCYVPAAFAQSLPFYVTFNTRIIGELHSRQDQYEPSSVALRVVAFGRVITQQDSV